MNLKSLSTQKNLSVSSAGICCAVGYSAQAASCALRAGMDHFQESEFLTPNGHPIRVARLPEQAMWGAQRTAQLMAYAVNDCLQNTTKLKDRELTLLVLCAEQQRTDELSTEIPMEPPLVQSIDLFRELIECQIHRQSQIWSLGKAGLSQVLERAKELLTREACQQVILLGVDNLIDASLINQYMEQARLLVKDNRDGFIPGEGAAAILLELAPVDTSGLQVLGWGQANEEGRPDGSIPSRARGLSTAIRTAFTQANINGNDLAWRMSDQNGEGFFAKEAANAMTRVAQDNGSTPMVLTTADLSLIHI